MGKETRIKARTLDRGNGWETILKIDEPEKQLKLFKRYVTLALEFEVEGEEQVEMLVKEAQSLYRGRDKRWGSKLLDVKVLWVKGGE